MSARGTDRDRVDALAASIYAEHRDRLLRVALQHCDLVEDAEEALNEAFLLFLSKYEPGRFENPVGWITTTLKRQCWEIARRRRDAQTVPEADDERGTPGFRMESLRDRAIGPAARAELGELAREVREAFARLKPQERRVLSLKALGYSYREIGELTGYSHTKINRCVAEGHARLRELGLNVHKSH